MLRSLSLLTRKLQQGKEIKKTLATFRLWQQQVAALPAPQTSAEKRLLIIRLDDIGDFILFRNTLPAYRTAPRFAGYKISLLANIVWKTLFDFTDADMADEVIWVNKHSYFESDKYRDDLWRNLRSKGFDTVVCPARGHPLLLDDICMLAAAPRVSMAPANYLHYQEWNQLSDSLYTDVYTDRTMSHEFTWNLGFASWCLGIDMSTVQLAMPSPQTNTNTAPYIICFIGGSKKSHRWLNPHWIELIRQVHLQGRYTCVIAGGKGDHGAAQIIAQATGAQNLAGEITLPEMAAWMHNAAAVITNDTMSVHMSVACGAPTLIVANGDNFYRFCDYKGAGIGNTQNAWPALFLRQWKKHNHKPFKHIAVTADIATISPVTVFHTLMQLLAAKH